MAFPFQWKLRWTYRTGCKNAETRAPGALYYVYVCTYMFIDLYTFVIWDIIYVVFHFPKSAKFSSTYWHEFHYISRRWNVLMCQFCLWSKTEKEGNVFHDLMFICHNFYFRWLTVFQLWCQHVAFAIFRRFPRLRIPDYNIYIYTVVHMYVFIFMNTSTLWMSCKIL